MADENEDIDKTLLKESGRASAIQDLAAKAKELSDRGKALEDTTIAEMTKNNRTLRVQNSVLIAAVIILIFLGAVQTYRATFITGPDLASVKETVEGPISDANVKLDAIIDFIESVQRAQENQSTDPQVQKVFDTIFEIKEILCQAQNQPLIQEKCHEMP